MSWIRHRGSQLRRALGSLVLVLFVLVNAGPAAGADDPATVVAKLLEALNTGNVPAALALLADDVVFTGSGGVTTGKLQVQPILQAGATQNRRIVRVGESKVDGERVTQLDRVTSDENRQLGIDFLEYVDVFVVKNGMVASFTSTITPESDAKRQKAAGGPPALPSGAPGAPGAPPGAPATAPSGLPVGPPSVGATPPSSLPNTGGGATASASNWLLMVGIGLVVAVGVIGMVVRRVGYR